MNDAFEKQQTKTEQQPAYPFGKPLPLDAIRTALAPDEKIVHVALVSNFGTKIMLFVFAMGCIGYYTFQSHLDSLVLGKMAMWIASIFLIGGFIVRHTEKFILTNHRLIIESGWLTITNIEMPYSRIESVVLKQDLLGQKNKYGDILIRGIGNSQHNLIGVENAPYFIERLNQLRHATPTVKG